MLNVLLEVRADAGGATPVKAVSRSIFRYSLIYLKMISYQSKRYSMSEVQLKSMNDVGLVTIGACM